MRGGTLIFMTEQLDGQELQVKVFGLQVQLKKLGIECSQEDVNGLANADASVAKKFDHQLHAMSEGTIPYDRQAFSRAAVALAEIMVLKATQRVNERQEVRSGGVYVPEPISTNEQVEYKIHAIFETSCSLKDVVTRLESLSTDDTITIPGLATAQGKPATVHDLVEHLTDVLKMFSSSVQVTEQMINVACVTSPLIDRQKLKSMLVREFLTTSKPQSREVSSGPNTRLELQKIGFSGAASIGVVIDFLRNKGLNAVAKEVETVVADLEFVNMNESAEPLSRQEIIDAINKQPELFKAPDVFKHLVTQLILRENNPPVDRAVPQRGFSFGEQFSLIAGTLRDMLPSFGSEKVMFDGEKFKVKKKKVAASDGSQSIGSRSNQDIQVGSQRAGVSAELGKLEYDHNPQFQEFQLRIFGGTTTEVTDLDTNKRVPKGQPYALSEGTHTFQLSKNDDGESLQLEITVTGKTAVVKYPSK